MKTRILADFQIWIKVPLNRKKAKHDAVVNNNKIPG